MDGRTARRDRNRDAVLDAVLDLFSEDASTPPAALVAERSGVSLRSVYRYFEDMDGLVRAAIGRSLERVQPLFEIDALGRGPLEERIERMVTRRLDLFERMAPMMRATLVQSRSNEILREQLETNRRALRLQVEDMFAPELDRMDAEARSETAAALDVLLGFESVEQLRQRRGFTVEETSSVIVRALGSMLMT